MNRTRHSSSYTSPYTLNMRGHLLLLLIPAAHALVGVRPLPQFPLISSSVKIKQPSSTWRASAAADSVAEFDVDGRLSSWARLVSSIPKLKRKEASSRRYASALEAGSGISLNLSIHFAHELSKNRLTFDDLDRKILSTAVVSTT